MKSWQMLAAVWLACLAGGGALGAEAESTPAPEPAQYLFLVEASARQEPQSERVALAVADLIERGLGGRMRDGDRFTILPYNERVDTPGYARKTWEAAQSREVSNLAFRYVQKAKFEKKVRLDRAMSLVQQAVLIERNLTIYLVCSGEDLITDTPFDREINAVLTKNIGAWRTRRAIGVIALVAEKGKIADWAVGVAEPPAPTRLVGRREAAPAPKPATNQIASQTVTNQIKSPAEPPKTNQSAQVTPPPPPPIAAKTNQVAEAPVKPAEPAVPKTNAVAVVTPKPEEPVITPQTAAPKTNETAAVKPPVTPPAPATNRITEATPPSPKTNLVAAVQPPERTPEPPAPPSPNPAAVTEPPKPPPPVTTAPAATNAAAPPPLTTATQIAAVAAHPEPETVTATAQVATVTTPPATNSASAVVAILPTQPPRPYGLIALGAGMLALAAWLAVAWHRRTRPAAGPSLITQSMNKDRAKKQP